MWRVVNKKAAALLVSFLLVVTDTSYPSRILRERPGKTNPTEQVSKDKCLVYSWRENVWTTTFWIGQGSLPSVPGSSSNRKSAWDRNWVASFGGVDHPTKRTGYRPAAFRPKQNTFYFALPFNDLKCRETAAKWVPWWDPTVPRWTSQVKGRWIAIEHNGRVAYAQWKDVGPWVTHDPEYIFRGEKHRGKAGLDVSPAVRDYLGLKGSGYTRWRFVDEQDVPPGPWWDYVPKRNIATQSTVPQGYQISSVQDRDLRPTNQRQ